METPKFENITCKELIHLGSPTIYQLKPKSEIIGMLKRMTLGEKNPTKANKTILLVGETGTGKSTLINALVNYAIGVMWEDDVWFNIIGDRTANQSESQTSDVIVYEIFGFEGTTLPFSLTIIDTPGYGDTGGMNRDSIISQQLYDWFRSEDGIHEISAVGLVLKATVNRLSDRLRYIFDSVVSLFGKGVKKNVVALITHSDGIMPRNALKALEAARIKCARDENNQIVHFLFDNCQTEDRTEDTEMLQSSESTSIKGLIQFTLFLSTIEPQKLTTNTAVLNERNRLEACIQNLQERITYIELKQKEIEESQRALANFEEEMKANADFTVEVEEVYKEKQKRIYVNKTRKVQMTLQDMKERCEANKAGSEQLSLQQSLEKLLQELEIHKNKMLNEAFQHVEMLEKIALNVQSLSTLARLDFLITRMRESKMDEKAKKLEEMKGQVDEGTRAALSSKQLADVENAEDATNFEN